MNLPNGSESEIQKLGGEPLEGSGFEDEKPSPVFQPYDQLGEEGSAR